MWIKYLHPYTGESVYLDTGDSTSYMDIELLLPMFFNEYSEMYEYPTYELVTVPPNEWLIKEVDRLTAQARALYETAIKYQVMLKEYHLGNE